MATILSEYSRTTSCPNRIRCGTPIVSVITSEKGMAAVVMWAMTRIKEENGRKGQASASGIRKESSHWDSETQSGMVVLDRPGAPDLKILLQVGEGGDLHLANTIRRKFSLKPAEGSNPPTIFIPQNKNDTQAHAAAILAVVARGKCWVDRRGVVHEQPYA